MVLGLGAGWYILHVEGKRIIDDHKEDYGRQLKCPSCSWTTSPQYSYYILFPFHTDSWRLTLMSGIQVEAWKALLPTMRH